jgi:hypothetical protein
MRLPTLAREKRQARAERQTASTEDNTTTGAAVIDERGAGTCNDSSLELIQIMPLIVHDLASFFKCFDKQETRWLVGRGDVAEKGYPVNAVSLIR